MSIAMRVAVAVVVLFSATSYTVEISKVEHNSAVDEKQFVKP